MSAADNFVPREEYARDLRDLRDEHRQANERLIETVERGFERMAVEIKISEEKWRDRAHEINRSIQAHELQLALHEKRADRMEKDAEQAREEAQSAAKEAAANRRWLVSILVTMVTMIAGWVGWVFDLFRGHRP